MSLSDPVEGQDPATPVDFEIRDPDPEIIITFVPTRPLIPFLLGLSWCPSVLCSSDTGVSLQFIPLVFVG